MHEFETGLFVSQPAWHGLGVVLDQPPSVEEAIGLAGLDWEVGLAQLKIGDEVDAPEDGDKTAPVGEVVTHRAVYRKSDGSVLGVVGPGFVPLQNRAAFQWFQPLIESGDFAIEAAGSLRNGKRIWILARAKDVRGDVVPGDEVRQYLLLAHGHDGTLAIRCGFTAVRVVCANTLSSALNHDASHLIKVHHRANAQTALDGVRELVEAARGDFKVLFAQLQELADKSCDDALLRMIVRETFAPGETNPEACPRIVDAVERLWAEGRGTDIKGVRGTLWGAYNAITEFLTHERGKSTDSRVEGVWFGESAKVSARALEISLRIARNQPLIRTERDEG